MKFRPIKKRNWKFLINEFKSSVMKVKGNQCFYRYFRGHTNLNKWHLNTYEEGASALNYLIMSGYKEITEERVEEIFKIGSLSPQKQKEDEVILKNKENKENTLKKVYDKWKWLEESREMGESEPIFEEIYNE